MTISAIDDDVDRILAARHHDPFTVLGKHTRRDGEVVRVLLPNAASVAIADGELALARMGDTDLFEWHGANGIVPSRYRIQWRDCAGIEHCEHDPYSFAPQIADFDLHLFSEGKHWHAYRFLGANPREVDGVSGVLFATWAPEAERVSVVGDFNGWDGRRHPMRVRGASGVWELFIPGVTAGTRYKYELRSRRSGAVFLKIDPYARQFERRPANATVVADAGNFEWADGEWMADRRRGDWLYAPHAAYEVHLGSWRREANGNFPGYRELAQQLVEHAVDLGFTHIELLPVTEHPLDASWGYQPMGFFAPTSRHGVPDDFRYFVDYCHRHGVGVLLDWVPGHFPRNSEGLADFDGSALYEHADPKLAAHPDWGTLVFNYGRREVRNFLISSAFFWMEEFHIDGLRVDAVASMLYLDYSREPGEWTPNVHGGRENLEAVEFLRELNRVVQGEHPGALVIAEESTSWPQVTRPTWLGGLGFSMKWDLGWMHDTLQYLSLDPIFRRYHHDLVTFGMLYAHSENFVLAFSHDEVVHGKRSLLEKMPGDEWQRFANLRLLYTYMYTYPGKKLLFMGNEIAQCHEWNHDASLDWQLLDKPRHLGVRDLVRDLNRLYRGHAALHRLDFDPQRGFEWIDCHDVAQSVLSFIRRGDGELVVICLNFTPVPRHRYRIGVPRPGRYEEIFNSDSEHYAGSNLGNLGVVTAQEIPWMGRANSIEITVPPLAGIVLRPVSD